jgi:hypothetical protein
MPHSVRRMQIDGPGMMQSARYDNEVRSSRCYSNLAEGEPQNPFTDFALVRFDAIILMSMIVLITSLGCASTEMLLGLQCCLFGTNKGEVRYSLSQNNASVPTS